MEPRELSMNNLIQFPTHLTGTKSERVLKKIKYLIQEYYQALYLSPDDKIRKQSELLKSIEKLTKDIK